LTLALCSTVNAELKQLDITIAGEEISYPNSSQGRRELAVKTEQILVPKLSTAIQVPAGKKIELVSTAAQFSQPHDPNYSRGANVTLHVGLEEIFPEISEPFGFTINFSGRGSFNNDKVHFRRSTAGGLLDGETQVFYGPCKVRLGFTPRFRGGYDFKVAKSFASATFKISDIDDSGSAGRGSNYSLVIPETSGDATLVLESSDDLVSWEADTVGDKPKGNRRKFYRLRAKKK
jgi:hypothetical protein